MIVRMRIGWLLMMTAILHMLLGVLLFWQPLQDMVDAGIINSITPHYDRGMIFWFLLFGALLLLLGHMTQWMQTHFGVIPESLGWGLFGLAVVGIIVMPVSGFWVVLPQAYLIIRVARTNRSSTV